MINRNVAIAVGILLLVILGFLFFSTMTGNVVTGSVVAEEIENDYFRIDYFGDKFEEGEDGVQNSG